MNVGQRIKERRKQIGMSADDLAEKLGKNRSTIYRYESGYIENMPLDVLKPIANALQTTPAHLMGWDSDEINAASEIQKDANEYTETEENILKDFIYEIAEMGFSHKEIENIRKYAHAVKHSESNSDELHTAYIELFVKMYELGLSIDDLHELYTYAQFLRSKRN